MKCDFCGSVTDIGLYREPVGDDVYKFVLSCKNCISSRVTKYSPAQIDHVHALAVADTDKKLSRIIRDEFRDIVFELGKDKRHHIPLIKYKRVSVACCRCHVGLSNVFDVEVKRLEWLAAADKWYCGDCRYYTTISCSKCHKAYEYHYRKMSLQFALKYFHMKQIPGSGCFCDDCYDGIRKPNTHKLDAEEKHWQALNSCCGQSLGVGKKGFEEEPVLEFDDVSEIKKQLKIAFYRRTKRNYIACS